MRSLQRHHKRKQPVTLVAEMVRPWHPERDRDYLHGLVESFQGAALLLDEMWSSLAQAVILQHVHLDPRRSPPQMADLGAVNLMFHNQLVASGDYSGQRRRAYEWTCPRRQAPFRLIRALTNSLFDTEKCASSCRDRRTPPARRKGTNTISFGKSRSSPGLQPRVATAADIASC